jgi:hypothetical protein
MLELKTTDLGYLIGENVRINTNKLKIDSLFD